MTGIIRVSSRIGGFFSGVYATPVFSPSGALGLLDGGPGLAIDFTDTSGLGSVAVKDLSNPTNNRSNVAADSWLTQSGTSPKWVQSTAGVWTQVSAGHIAIEYNGGYYLLVEAGVTPLARRSRRLDDGTDWTRTNITPSTVVGVDGVNASATRITATAGNATAIGSANTLTSAARKWNPFVRRVAGIGDLQWSLDGGSTWTSFVGITSSYQRMDVGATLANPQVGFRIVSSGDSFDIDFANGETGKLATSPIETAASTATRAADNINVATSKFPLGTSAISAYYQVNLLGENLSNVGLLALSKDGNNFSSLGHGQAVPTDGPRFVNSSGGVQDVDVSGFSGFTTGALKAAFRLQANDFAIFYNGGNSSTDASCSLPVGLSLLSFWNNNVITNPGAIFRVMKFVMVPSAWPNATLAAKTA